MKYLLVGLAGIAGALLRFFVGMILPADHFAGYPLGTLLVNWIGCFLLSWLTIWSTRVIDLSEPLRLALTTGLLGSFTTFSTLSVEVIELFRGGAWEMAVSHVLLHLFGGLLFAWGGYSLAVKQVRRKAR
jgi:CrcB protein